MTTTRPTRQASAERSMWNDAALALLLDAKSVILKATRAHCSDDPWRAEASRWVQRHAAFTGDEDELVPHVETVSAATLTGMAAIGEIRNPEVFAPWEDDDEPFDCAPECRCKTTKPAPAASTADCGCPIEHKQAVITRHSYECTQSQASQRLAAALEDEWLEPVTPDPAGEATRIDLPAAG